MRGREGGGASNASNDLSMACKAICDLNAMPALQSPKQGILKQDWDAFSTDWEG